MTTELDESHKSLIRDSFASQTMMETIGARISTIQKGAVQINAPILPGTKQQNGYGHAALTFALGDTAAGYAAISALDPGWNVLTAEIKINLLAPAKGAELRATGHVIKSGRRVVVVSSDIHAIDDKGRETLIAVMQGTMIPIAPE